MKLPLQITWRDIERTDALEAAIRSKAAKLDEFYDQIMSCKVMVEAPHHRHKKGNLFRISLDIKVPDKEIVVTRGPAKDHAHEDMYVSIRDAFDAARRQLQDYARVRRGAVKHHEVAHQAKVQKYFPDEDYGFLETPDGREIYFHRNALVNTDFEKLEEGQIVRYVEEIGKEGPQAKQVSVGQSR